MDEKKFVDELARDFIKWMNKNNIPLRNHSNSDIDEYMMKHLRAAG